MPLTVRRTDADRAIVTYRNGFIVDLPHWTREDTDQLVASELKHWLKRRVRYPFAFQFLALVVGQIDEPAVEQDVDLGFVYRPVRVGTDVAASYALRSICLNFQNTKRG
jgi:hypothetical protein